MELIVSIKHGNMPAALLGSQSSGRTLDDVEQAISSFENEVRSQLSDRTLTVFQLSKEGGWGGHTTFRVRFDIAEEKVNSAIKKALAALKLVGDVHAPRWW